MLCLPLSAASAAASFTASQPVPLDWVASFSAVADFDRDGRADLVLVSRPDREMNVLLGRGEAPSHLESRAVLGFGSALRQPAVGDLNDDGDLDVAVPDDGAGGVWILLGQGNGTFLPPYLVHVGRAPFSVAIADFDGMHNDDLAVADAKQGRIFIRLNDGETPPGFQNGPDLEAGEKPVAVVAADLNRDGKPDVTWLDVGGAGTKDVGVNILERVAAGFPIFGPGGVVTVGENPEALTAVDVNDDEVADLVMLNRPFSPHVSFVDVLLGRGDGVFLARQSFELRCPFFTGGEPCRPLGFAPGHFAGGSDVDLAVVFHDPRDFSSTDALQAFAGRGDGTFVAASVAAVGKGLSTIAAGDFDGGGAVDVAVATRRAQAVQALLNVPVPGATPNGSPCILGDECLAGRCTNGRCCATTCLDFERCDVPGLEGACVPVVVPLACTADLDCPGRCRGEPSRECLDDPECTTGDRCEPRGCRDGFCCDATCSSFGERCDVPGFEGVCIPKSEVGESCFEEGDCATGFCRDGFCCNEDCPEGFCGRFGQEGICQAKLPLGASCGDDVGAPRDDVCASAICDCFDLVCCADVCTADEFCGEDGLCAPFEPVGPPVCGNRFVEEGETCDDGGLCLADGGDPCVGEPNCPGGQECVEGFCVLRCTASNDCPSGVCKPVGGDGCAANCTEEDLRAARLDTANSPSRIQTTNTVIHVNLAGVQGLRTGRPRAQRVVNPQGEGVTEPGEIPVVAKANDAAFEPLSIPGLVCACVRPAAAPDVFGPNLFGSGKIGCGAKGLANVDYLIVQDHNTNPGDPNNGATGGQAIPQLPDDPECDDQFVFPSGIASAACRELSGDPGCDDGTSFFHPGICNSPRTIQLFGGNAARGSALIHTSVRIGLLADTGQCRTDRPMQSGQCLFRDYGPDCLPCTRDDLARATVESLSLTTGTAAAAVYDAGNVVVPGFGFPPPIDEGSGAPCGSDEECAPHERCRRTCEASGFPCDDDSECPNDACRSRRCEVLCGGLTRCLTVQTGKPFDCDALIADPSYGLTGGVLAVTFPDVDALRIGDSVTASLLAFERGVSVPTDTPTPTTVAQNPTATPTEPGSTPTNPAADTPTPTPTEKACTGDCDRSGMVLVDELVVGVNIALGRMALPACPFLDEDGSSAVSIDELVRAVKSATRGCAS